MIWNTVRWQKLQKTCILVAEINWRQRMWCIKWKDWEMCMCTHFSWQGLWEKSGHCGIEVTPEDGSNASPQYKLLFPCCSDSSLTAGGGNERAVTHRPMQEKEVVVASLRSGRWDNLLFYGCQLEFKPEQYLNLYSPGGDNNCECQPWNHVWWRERSVSKLASKLTVALAGVSLICSSVKWSIIGLFTQFTSFK